MSDEIVQMIKELADRAISGKRAGYGSPESRSAALIMRAIDDLSLAAQTDPEASADIYKVIQQLKERYSSPSPHQSQPTQLPKQKEGKGREGDWGREKEGEKKDGNPSLDTTNPDAD